MEDAEVARDAGIAQVSASNAPWMTRAVAMAISRIPPFVRVTGEDIRSRLTDAGLEAPSKPNAWGALTMTLAKRGHIMDSGEWRRMRSPSSHARRTPVYIRTDR